MWTSWDAVTASERSRQSGTNTHLDTTHISTIQIPRYLDRRTLVKYIYRIIKTWWIWACIKTSAVKRFKYWIAMNRINVIVNLRLIANNCTILSILNVPWFIFVLLFFLILMLLSTWKCGSACFLRMFFYLTLAYTAVFNFTLTLSLGAVFQGTFLSFFFV